jgi:hypothetical protein
MFSTARTRESKTSALLAICALLVCLTSALLIENRHWAAKASSVSANDRECKIIELESLKDVLKVELLNLESANFPRDFEIRVTNLTKKPIYRLYLKSLFPETKQVTGATTGIHYEFGPSRLTDLAELSKATDVSLEPGASVVLSSNADRIEDFMKYFNALSFNPSEKITKVILSVQVVSFGDGTGYIAGDASPAK